MDCDSAIKSNETLMYAIIGMNPENIKPERKGQIFYDCTYMK